MSVALFLEIKNEYTEHLVDTLSPFIYEGLTSVYKEAVRVAEESNTTDKILMIFQKFLQNINNWSQAKVDNETIRIKQLSNTADYLDDLVKAVIKSNIILLTYSNTISNVIGQSFYNTFTTSTFIHRCYAECGKDAHNNPYLFFHDIEPMDYKRNQIIIQQHIQTGVARAVRKMLPLSMILKEYLLNSANIIQEPPKVELMGTHNLADRGSILPPLNISQPVAIGQYGQHHLNPQLDQVVAQKIITENKIDPKLEREVMKIIKSENIKTDKQVIRDIMNIDKIITSMDHNKTEQNTRMPFEEDNNHRKLSEMLVNIPMDGGNFDILNNRLGKSDKKILNINFDDDANTDNNVNKKSVSATSMSGRAMPSRNHQRLGIETSEKMDPSKVKLIENYGQSNVNHKRSK